MKIKDAKFSMYEIDSMYLKYVSEFVERKCWTKAFKNPIISFTRDLLVSITARSGGKFHIYLIE